MRPFEPLHELSDDGKEGCSKVLNLEVLNLEVEGESRRRKEGSSGKVEAFPSIVKWSFGEGHEGVFVQPTTGSEQVLVVGRSVPWWGMVIARLDLRIHSILLSDDRFSPVVRKYFGTGIPMGKNVCLLYTSDAADE